MRRSSGHDFVDPIILKVLKQSKRSMSVLGINYMVNGIAEKTINLNVINEHMKLMVKARKVSETLKKSTGVKYYKLV
ncbi:hypothetical protein EPN87_02955 [archaeon]|nr:MAG: hypothetical protein EPN87_02955 [archaeon]